MGRLLSGFLVALIGTESAVLAGLSPVPAQDAPAPAPPINRIRQLSLTTNDLVYDPLRQKIYATLPSSVGPTGNSVVAIDPLIGTLGASVFLGSEPNRVVISDDSQYLYVGLDGAFAVRRVDLATNTAGLQFALGTDSSWGPLVAGDAFVLPRSAATLVVSRRAPSYPYFRSIAVFDDGVMRPIVATSNVAGPIEPASVPVRLYSTDGSDLFRHSIYDSGVVLSDTYPDVFNSAADIQAENDLVYATNGRVVDATSGLIQGTYTTSTTSGNLILPEAAADRVYVLTAVGSNKVIQVFDRDAFVPMGTIQVPGVSGTPTSLIRWGTNGLAFRTSSGQVFLVENTLIGASRTVCDFDRDGKTDISVWRPSNGTWYVLPSSGAPLIAQPFGQAGDIPVPGDYDADAKADVAVWRPSDGVWYILQSAFATVKVHPFGMGGDVPMARDFDGDGKTDVAVWRPSDGIWYILQSSNGAFRAQAFGAGTDLPVAADFDGDRKADIAVFRPSNGVWYILQSSNGVFRAEAFGASGDRPVPGDFDADGKAELAVFRPSDGTWYMSLSATGAFRAVGFGIATDVPVVGDYDGDGKADVAVYRDGAWYILMSADSSVRAMPFGVAGDVALPARYF